MRYVNVSIGTKDSHMMISAANALAELGIQLDYRCIDTEELDADPVLLNEAMDYIRDADFVTMKVHGDTSYFKRFDRMRKVVDRYKVPTVLLCTEDEVTRAYRYMFPYSDEDHLRCCAYLQLGGDENLLSLLKWAVRTFDGIDIEVPDPVHPPAQGLYYPGRESIDIASYLETLDPSKPKVGIFFFQRQWLSGDTQPIDRMIGRVEELGASAVPVFMYSSENKVAGAKGMKRILMEDLVSGGEPVLDAIICTMGFSQILLVSPGAGEQVSDDNFFARYGVPVIQTPTVARSAADWREDINGMSPAEISYNIAHTEFDGQIISTASACYEREPDNTRVTAALEDRPARVAETAVMWARLRHKPDSERKVGILLYMYPPTTANAGGASGLDTFQSVVDLLHRMRDAGYDVGDGIPETSRELVDSLLAGITNDTTWVSDDSVPERAADMITPEEYDVWYSRLSDLARARLEKDWGKAPGEFNVFGGNLMVPGVVYGNVIVGFQPDRARDSQADYHDPHTVMPHQYLSYYRWLKYDFKADAVIHVGTHGTLEWLPGKSVALSGDCCPDYVQDSLPDIYPYIIGNPGEGTQAKRRAEAVIVDHMIPAMARAGGYDDIQELEGTVQNYMAARAVSQTEKMDLIRVKLREVVGRLEFYNDLKMSPDCSDAEFDSRIDDLYDYVTDVKENLIKDGLHILGRVPEGKRLEENIYSLMRLDNGDVPSMRGSIAAVMGYDILDLQNDASSWDEGSGLLKGQVLERVEESMDSLIGGMHSAGFSEPECLELVDSMFPGENSALKGSVEYVCRRLYPDLMAMGGEIDSIMRALRGEYIEPGPSGCPTRGRAQLLPTGKNFYSLDPDSIPWHSSWEVGKRMADQMLERYVSEHGTYPKTVGIVMWATDTMKTGGDDVAYVLWLLGLKPVWSGYAGRVTDLEVIPVPELGRPRVDVTLRISGLFRDTFPNLVEMIDTGVRRIADLDETDEENFLKANLRADIVRSIEDGMPEEEAREDALIRVFGDAPGTYGSGTNILIRTSDWKDVKDIGDIYQSYGHYAYGNGRKGKAVPEMFRRRLERMEVTVKNSVSREYDMFDNDDVYNDLGGFNAAVRAVSGRMPMSVIGFSADTSNLKTKTVDEEGRYIFRSKIMNPKWVEGLKQHGFKGAQEISSMAEYVFGWDATSDIVDGWMYQAIADHFLFDEENSQWMREENPYAMFETASRLLEAIGRGMWDADDDTKERLERIYVDLEGQFEGSE